MFPPSPLSPRARRREGGRKGGGGVRAKGLNAKDAHPPSLFSTFGRDGSSLKALFGMQGYKDILRLAETLRRWTAQQADRLDRTL